MRDVATPYGTARVGTQEEVFNEMARLIMAESLAATTRHARIGLSGGSTPKAFYVWTVEHGKIPYRDGCRCLWMVSDERHVPLSSPDSNFGTLDSLLLEPLEIPQSHKLPWPVDLPAPACAAEFSRHWDATFGPNAGFDLCFLGLGEDCHTASLWPGCPLLSEEAGAAGDEAPFTATQWPGRGWRLTVTEAGLRASEKIVVLALGAGKAEALRKVMHEPVAPRDRPAQLLKPLAPKVLWLLDEAAAAGL